MGAYGYFATLAGAGAADPNPNPNPTLAGAGAANPNPNPTLADAGAANPNPNPTLASAQPRSHSPALRRAPKLCSCCPLLCSQARRPPALACSPPCAPAACGHHVQPACPLQPAPCLTCTPARCPVQPRLQTAGWASPSAAPARSRPCRGQHPAAVRALHGSVLLA
jgi:hypothetical protein